MHKKFKKGASLITAFTLIGVIMISPLTVDANEALHLQRLNTLYGENFSKDDYLTREEFYVTVSKMFISENPIDETSLPFEDAEQIKPENAAYLLALYEKGVLSESEEDGGIYINPAEKITRQEAIAFLGKVLSKYSEYNLVFNDSGEVADWAKKYVAWFAERKIILGYPDGSLRPDSYITAGEFSLLVIKTLDFESLNNALVSTFLGTGSQGLVDGDLKATRFALPYSIFMDKDKNIIVADTYNNALRKIESGVSKTISGSIINLDSGGFPQGYYLDDVLNNALLNRPCDGVVNSKGQIFIADSANSVIRFVRDGKMYTYSGTTPGYKDGEDDVAQFNRPTAIAIDKSDNIYIADTLNNCIRKIDTKGNVTTIAGTPAKAGLKDGNADSALFCEPSGIAIGSDGAIYIADTGNQRIRKIINGQVTTIAGAASATDADGYVYGGFADGSADSAMFNLPKGLAMAGDILLVADSANNRIRAITPSGEVITILGNGEPGDKDGNALEAMLHQPMGIFYENGLLYIADTANNKIKVMDFDPNLFNAKGE